MPAPARIVNLVVGLQAMPETGREVGAVGAHQPIAKRPSRATWIRIEPDRHVFVEIASSFGAQGPGEDLIRDIRR